MHIYQYVCVCVHIKLLKKICTKLNTLNISKIQGKKKYYELIGASVHQRRRHGPQRKLNSEKKLRMAAVIVQSSAVMLVNPGVTLAAQDGLEPLCKRLQNMMCC